MVPHPLQRFLGPPDVRASLARAQDEAHDRSAPCDRRVLQHPGRGGLLTLGVHGSAVPSPQQASLVAALREATFKISLLHTGVPRSVVTFSEASLVHCPFPRDIGLLGDKRSSPHHAGLPGSVGPHHSGASLVHSSPHSISLPGDAVLKPASNTTKLFSSVSTSTRNIVIKRPYFYEQRERGVRTLHASLEFLTGERSRLLHQAAAGDARAVAAFHAFVAHVDA